MKYEDMAQNKELATGLLLANVPPRVRDTFIGVVGMVEAMNMTDRPDPDRVQALLLRFYMDGVALEDPGVWSLKGRAEMFRSLLEYSLAVVTKKCEAINSGK